MSRIGMIAGALVVALVVWVSRTAVTDAVPASRLESPPPGREAPARTKLSAREPGSSAAPAPLQRAVSPVPATAAEPAELARSWVVTLVAQLRQLAGLEEEKLYMDEAHELLDVVAGPGVPEAARHARAVAMLERLDGDVSRPRVRGGLLALLGAWGRQAEVLARVGTSGVDWRTALAGLLRAPDGGQGRSVALKPREFLARNERERLDCLPWVMDRQPEGALRERLQALVSTYAPDYDSLFVRDLAVLGLGTRLDEDPVTLSLFAELLFDTSSIHRQIRPSLVFALAKAAGEEARSTLLAFLEDDQAGEFGKFAARRLIAENGRLSAELELLVEPLRSGDSSSTDRLVALAHLSKRLGELGTGEHGAMVELLCERAAREQHETARLAAVGLLASTGGGRPRLDALDAVLRTDDSTGCRVWAARGLASVAPELAGEARALLEVALATESDPDVASAIEEALAQQAQQP